MGIRTYLKTKQLSAISLNARRFQGKKRGNTKFRNDPKAITACILWRKNVTARMRYSACPKPPHDAAATKQSQRRSVEIVQIAAYQIAPNNIIILPLLKKQAKVSQGLFQ